MITFVSNKINVDTPDSADAVVEIACLSTDTKPTDGIVTGSVAIEVDTGDVYLYDEASTTWNRMCSIKE